MAISARHQPSPAPASTAAQATADSTLPAAMSASVAPRHLAGETSTMYSGLTVMQMPEPTPKIRRHAMMKPS